MGVCDCEEPGETMGPVLERLEVAAQCAAPYHERHSASFAGEWVSEEGMGEYHVAYTDDVELHRRALSARLPEPQILRVHRKRYALARLLGIQDQIAKDASGLARDGVLISSAWPDCDLGLEVAFVAADSAQATALLRERYGPELQLRWLGAEWYADEVVPWARYAAGGCERELIVQYGTNSCFRFGHVAVSETPEEVRITVVERAPVGFRTQAGRGRRAVAQLSAPLDRRVVIDGATGEPRPPRWFAEHHDRVRLTGELQGEDARGQPRSFGPGTEGIVVNVRGEGEAFLVRTPREQSREDHGSFWAPADLLELLARENEPPPERNAE
jgi:hypothetical protein